MGRAIKRIHQDIWLVCNWCRHRISPLEQASGEKAPQPAVSTSPAPSSSAVFPRFAPTFSPEMSVVWAPQCTGRSLGSPGVAPPSPPGGAELLKGALVIPPVA
eukprot:CAMPEP_0174347914 /NCGR_PEP_ID=MMETSP0811_2-20130205/4156_1 /TAXON_ID=73025 ORGANISM="Eutreptiella gymnastica-like, Strain CCMP1594" /NCGR_SAMPLE_ID=MMETSP0811_2 /ASSEMBLY_ACC=CAM_ASM_000667 /LENGTH=102 /DNA_ID=CAMNT_0015473935 /DNA_START=168 /DNA_END=476 /DNA_ORIENTATION=+